MSSELKLSLSILISIFLIVIVAYIFIILISFFAMHDITSKLKKSYKKMIIILFQKSDSLNKIFDILEKNDPSSFVNRDLKKVFFSTNYEKEDPKMIGERFTTLLNFEKKLVSEIVNSSLGDSRVDVVSLLDAVSLLDKRFMQTKQSYNSLVVGYNYRLNVYTTRWVKRLFKISKKEMIE
jgi:hypothetical protein